MKLTAHTMSVKDINKSFKEGAYSYIPKERIAGFTALLCDILKNGEKNAVEAMQKRIKGQGVLRESYIPHQGGTA